MRIVSLIASSTEIVAALGLEDQLVGRSHECDHPASVKRLPVCTSPKFPVTGSSADIDRRVKETLQSETSVYAVDAKLLDDLRPEVIVTQAQCEVCAVSLRDVEAAVAEMTTRPRIVSLNPNSLADVWDDMRAVAAACGVRDRGERLIARCQQRMRAVAERVRGRPRPTVACIEWVDPLMAAGNWVPELVDLAGGEDLFGEAGKHSPWMTWEDLVRRDPDVIVVMPCGFDLARTKAELPALTGRPGWDDLKAVRSGRVWAADGNAYFNRPGPRLVEALEMLAEALHPEVCRYGHMGMERYQS
ncbi:MAG TPA: cobalamin-binding protein [Gemmataceae bacterium]|nr:cobalamin-binding protein [Gemmataceae bacterium]